MIVVTGAPGHLGNNLVRLLVERGERVRAMVLPGEDLTPLRGLDVEIVEGDVRDPESLDNAFRGADLVFHLASIISLLPGRSELLEQVNVRGARNVAEACLRNGVRRLVHTSSIHALVEPPRGVGIDENSGLDPLRVSMEYSKTKARGTLEVLDVIRKGLDGVIVYPTGVIGPNDFKPSEVGKMIIYFIRGHLPISIEGGYNFVDVRDVAHGHILAAEKGRTGEGYILAGEWISVTDVLKEVASVVGRPVPKLKLSPSAATAVAKALTSFSRMTGKKPLVSEDMVEALLSNSEVSSTKALTELGFKPRPIRETIRDTVLWFKEQGMV
ncbi:MAG TPA: SDR family oxidoreductase [Firmicutes bacterium]|nr:SDR family oxidoreductase [Candidatus Fermentithermobacillaceae bacterium]